MESDCEVDIGEDMNVEEVNLSDVVPVSVDGTLSLLDDFSI